MIVPASEIDDIHIAHRRHVTVLRLFEEMRHVLRRQLEVIRQLSRGQEVLAIGVVACFEQNKII